jgi:hypothetical protein
MAWSTWQLYSDPASTDAFRRAVETLGSAPHYPWRLELGMDGFSHDGVPIPPRREASTRVAHRLFSVGAAAVELRGPPSGEDLDRLFTQIDSTGGALPASGRGAILILDREMLLAESTRPGSDASATDTRSEPDGPTALVLDLLQRKGPDPPKVAGLFVDEYERAYLLADHDDPWAIEELVRSFVDGFWYLPEDHRAQVFSLMLERADRPGNTAFLDQFGSIEMAELNRFFGEAGHPLLAEYLRVATRVGGRHPDDLAELVGSGSGGSIADRIVERVAEVLGTGPEREGHPSAAAVARLRSSLPDPVERTRSIGNILSTLFRLAETPDAARGAARVWARQVAGSLAAGHLAEAEERLALPAGAESGPALDHILMPALATAMHGEAVDTLARLLIAPGPHWETSAIRRAALRFAAGGLIREIAGKAGVSRRRALEDALAVVAQAHPETLVPHLEDPHWFVVRSVLAALRGARRPELADHVHPLTRHADPRVRAEALSALHGLHGAAATSYAVGATKDADPGVRARAALILGALDGPASERALTEMAVSRGIDDAGVALKVLARMSRPGARDLVERLASRRLALTGRSRKLRTEARRALEAARE